MYKELRQKPWTVHKIFPIKVNTIADDLFSFEEIILIFFFFNVTQYPLPHFHSFIHSLVITDAWKMWSYI